MVSIVLQCLWLLHGDCTALDSFLENAGRVINSEGDVFNTVTMLGVMLVELFLTLMSEW